ncbi:MAG TPA: RNB domain-containing ribonuclease, partial [Allosphingosinicella sp.]
NPPRNGEGDHAKHGGGAGAEFGETPPSVLRTATSPSRGGSEREDLTHIPIVAIDPADARDHDDAVWAAEDDDPANAGGWKAIVAIADVSFYVRPGSALDKEARKRGNSVYFPDRVVPMLPETLSADVCSLKEGEDRAALVCHLQISKDGQLKSWRFTRARVRIAANIAYEDAQAAIDALLPATQKPFASSEVEKRVSTSLDTNGGGMIEVYSSPCSMPDLEVGDSPVPQALVKSTLVPLWACWNALYKAREKRAPLDLDLPERRVMLDEKGRIMSVAPRERLDAHKLIEDYMIAANVAAAKALEAKKAPVMYRDHEPPSREKLVALKDYLKTFEIEFALGQVVRPQTFNHILGRIGEADFKPQVMEQVLRTQTQAYYSPDNKGHFGLALGSYAHFTSPIRRYADLIVHRALTRAYRLGEGGLTDHEAEAMEVTGELISQHERRAMEAERETIDRYVAAYLADHVGEIVDCRITGVQPFGFFATVEGLGGDGLVPVSTLGTDYFRYDEARQVLAGDETGEEYTLGQRLKLRLAEADPVSGALRFELPEGGSYSPVRRALRRDRGAAGKPARRMQGKRGRPGNIRHQGRKR